MKANLRTSGHPAGASRCVTDCTISGAPPQSEKENDMKTDLPPLYNSAVGLLEWHSASMEKAVRHRKHESLEPASQALNDAAFAGMKIVEELNRIWASEST